MANGKEVTKQGEIKKAIKNFYSNLYQEKSIETTELEEYILTEWKIWQYQKYIEKK